MTAICSVRQVLPNQRHALGGAEDALDGTNGSLLVEILLGLLAEGEGAVAVQGDDGGRPPLAFVIGHDVRLAELEVGDDRVAGAKVNADVGHGAYLMAGVAGLSLVGRFLVTLSCRGLLDYCFLRRKRGAGVALDGDAEIVRTNRGREGVCPQGTGRGTITLAGV